jgi:hypothetical protein
MDAMVDFFLLLFNNDFSTLNGRMFANYELKGMWKEVLFLENMIVNLQAP